MSDKSLTSCATTRWYPLSSSSTKLLAYESISTCLLSCESKCPLFTEPWKMHTVILLQLVGKGRGWLSSVRKPLETQTRGIFDRIYVCVCLCVCLYFKNQNADQVPIAMRPAKHHHRICDHTGTAKYKTSGLIALSPHSDPSVSRARFKPVKPCCAGWFGCCSVVCYHTCSRLPIHIHQSISAAS